MQLPLAALAVAPVITCLKLLYFGIIKPNQQCTLGVRAGSCRTAAAAAAVAIKAHSALERCPAGRVLPDGRHGVCSDRRPSAGVSATAAQAHADADNANAPPEDGANARWRPWILDRARCGMAASGNGGDRCPHRWRPPTRQWQPRLQQAGARLVEGGTATRQTCRRQRFDSC